MGALVTRALRPIKSFNIENRAHRVISKEKPTPAPLYQKNLEDLQRTIEAVPDLDDKLDKKDVELDNRLREVYVTSHGRPEDDVTSEKRKKKSSTRPLPESRMAVEDYEFGFKEPDNLRPGRTTLRLVIEFITAHQSNPKEATAERIAEEYKLRLDDVKDLLKYFKTFEIYIPETKKTPAVFAGPATMRQQLLENEEKQKQLDATKDNVKNNEILLIDEHSTKTNDVIEPTVEATAEKEDSKKFEETLDIKKPRRTNRE